MRPVRHRVGQARQRNRNALRRFIAGSDDAAAARYPECLSPWGTPTPMTIADAYNRFIVWIGDGTGASDSLLHVHAGMAVLLLARVISRRSLATPIPFAVVCVAEFGNELMDRVHNGTWLWADTSLDIVNTLFWPFVLMVGLRLRRSREDWQPVN